MKKHLVMLHGFGSDSRIFSSFAGKLSKEYNVMLVDIPGHGQTTEGFRDFSFSAYTVLHALDSYIGEPYVLLGWSMGGQIALEMFKQKISHKCGDEHCAHNPIVSLILISSTPKFVASEDFPAGMNKAVFRKFKKGIAEDPDKYMDDFNELIFSPGEESGKYIEGLKQQRPSRETLSACMESFERFDERSVLPAVNIPALILAGGKDRIIDPKISVFMSQEIKGSALRLYNDSGHAPFLTNEEKVIEDVRRFI